MHVLRWLAIVPALHAGASTADVNADHRPLIDAASLPQKCKQFLDVPSDAKTDEPLWGQRLSIAACLTDAILVEPVTDLAKVHDMVTKLDHEIEPSVAIYQDAIAKAPREFRVIAAYGLGMTYANALVRARNAIPRAGDITSELFESYQRTLDPLLAGDREHALAAFRAAVKLADSDPAGASGNPVILKFVAASRESVRQLTSHP